MKAVVLINGKQHLVSKDDVFSVDHINTSEKKIAAKPLLVIDDSNVLVGKPSLDDKEVTYEIIGENKSDKVTAIRYKAKKRVNKVRGHRQLQSQIRIVSIK